ncbi:MAG: M20/M25/M40 family metallo-hydrolase [Alphaproteobacteria bacterium]|nr:M20/M25/M40 family metallo-hydrolase [Alphaproteobacteria bacterium]
MDQRSGSIGRWRTELTADPVLSFLEQDRAAALERLMALLRCPSVSTDPAYAQGMGAARELLMARLARAGFGHVREISAGGHPAIYGEWCGQPGRPTFLVYGHYDVQPPDPIADWSSPPFEPRIVDGRIRARGVSDDKAPLSIAIEAMAGFLHVEGRLPVNVKLLLEGEEECGSATLGQICERHRDLLAADAVISADGARWRTDLCTVNVGSRGNAALEFSLTTAARDLHSGRFGGATVNALHAMARLLASLHEADGRVAVEDFYDDARLPEAADLAMLARIPFDESGFFREFSGRPHGEPGYGTLARLWLRPTLEMNGMWGGYTGAGAKTIVPHRAEAKLTMRLADGQDPARVVAAVRRHLKNHCPAGAQLDFRDTSPGSRAYTVPENHPLLLAVERTLADVTGAQPVRVRIGATLPLSDIVSTRLGLDTVMFSFSTADEKFHAPDEFFRLASFDKGLRAWVLLLRRLGLQTPYDYARFQHRPERPSA